MSSFKEKFAEYIRFTEDNLRKYNAPADGETAQKDLISAMNYSLEAGGKRIRPTLVYAFCEACGGDFRKAAAPAAAIEMIHTFSLIHDDLPAMDNDDFRRGKPSCHKAFGEAMAILAGDALSVLPFEIIADDTALDAQSKVRIFSELTKAVGRNGMIGGQVIDVKETGHAVPKDVLDTIYELKTGALIECAMMIGAILGGAEEEDVRKVEKIAHYVGIAFQIQDDILDVTSTEEVLGKPIHSDEKNQKTTYVTLLGIEQAQKRVEELSNQAIDLLHQLSGENEYLEQLLIQLIHRDR